MAFYRQTIPISEGNISHRENDRLRRAPLYPPGMEGAAGAVVFDAVPGEPGNAVP